MSELLEPYELPSDEVRDAWRRLTDDYMVMDRIEPSIAARLIDAGVGRFAELGAAIAPISRLLEPAGVSCVAVDLNPPAGSFDSTVCGDLGSVPLASESLDAASAVNCLYFLDDPSVGVREAHRLLRPGGLFVAGAPSWYHDPELQDIVPGWGDRSSFDAEEAAEIVAASFNVIDVEWWEGPGYVLADESAVLDYLVAFKVPEADRLAALVETPVTITKSGVNVWARK